GGARRQPLSAARLHDLVSRRELRLRAPRRPDDPSRTQRGAHDRPRCALHPRRRRRPTRRRLARGRHEPDRPQRLRLRQTRRLTPRPGRQPASLRIAAAPLSQLGVREPVEDDAMQPVPDTGAATALELAAIRPERRGRRRLSGLTQPERELYRWILQRFATAGPPSGQATCATALELGLAPDQAL